MHSDVEQNAVFVQLDQPRARADVRVGFRFVIFTIQFATDEHRWTQIIQKEEAATLAVGGTAVAPVKFRRRAGFRGVRKIAV